MCAADERARGTIGLRRHAARVHDDYIGSQGLKLAHRAQISCDGLAIGAGRPATEVLYVKCGHSSSLLNWSDSPEARLTV
jgi:hypothetical protein